MVDSELVHSMHWQVLVFGFLKLVVHVSEKRNAQKNVRTTKFVYVPTDCASVVYDYVLLIEKQKRNAPGKPIVGRLEIRFRRGQHVRIPS